MNTRRSATPPTVVQMKGPADHNRTEAEGFVRAAFARAYDAEIHEFMPTLMGLRGDQGDLLAVLGLREAENTALYLEHYLDQTVEQALSKALGLANTLNRADLIEVGNFAVSAAGGGRWLITALTAYLHGANHQWAVFTCGPELQNAFRRLGVDLVDLGLADPARLPDSGSNQWGSYYQQKPRVMAASVAQSHAALTRLHQHECALLSVWNGALQAGRLTK